jgi:hypothetical protein
MASSRGTTQNTVEILISKISKDLRQQWHITVYERQKRCLLKLYLNINDIQKFKSIVLAQSFLQIHYTVEGYMNI